MSLKRVWRPNPYIRERVWRPNPYIRERVWRPNPYMKQRFFVIKFTTLTGLV